MKLTDFVQDNIKHITPRRIECGKDSLSVFLWEIFTKNSTPVITAPLALLRAQHDKFIRSLKLSFGYFYISCVIFISLSER